MASSWSSSEIFKERLGLEDCAWLADVPCNVDFVLGTARIQLRDLVALEPHSVVKLDQLAGADLDLWVEDRRLAAAEVVVVDNKAGVRVTRIVPADASPSAEGATS